MTCIKTQARISTNSVEGLMLRTENTLVRAAQYRLCSPVYASHRMAGNPY